ncbi:major facilitator superfamily domain-containing protein [Radiomyces spectabilis]|uniref:major facilitator superfamily domain-containing protein n=1 Tax=Radiomyces spectabilis TaxID=64574 RepID=UPI00221FBB48|nr:major facilitator superfamily domain-containing protein [Radiomyces spectabilis]KAI8377465.1 major facilitator superfamily domain-containing protein [Radiomyces spectabilis]
MTSLKNRPCLAEATPLLPKPLTPKEKPSYWFAILLPFGVAFGTGALLAPQFQFYTEIFCDRYYEAKEVTNMDITDIEFVLPLKDCAIPEIQAIVSRAYAVMTFLTFASALLMASYYGSLSDRKGRKLVLFISALGNITPLICYIATAKYQEYFGVTLLYLAPLLKGLLAGENIQMAAIQAYISDCTTRRQRTTAFGRMLASIYIGATLGPSVASILIEKTHSILAVFYLAVFVHFLFGIYTAVIPESNEPLYRPSETKIQAAPSPFWKRLNVFSALTILSRTEIRHLTPCALPILGTIQFLMTAVAMPPTLLYAMLKFDWTAVEGGVYVSIASFSRLIMMAAVLPAIALLFHKKSMRSRRESTKSNLSSSSTGSSPSSSSSSSSLLVSPPNEEDVEHNMLLDTWMIRVGVATETLALLLFGLATNGTSFTLIVVLQSLSLLGQPSLRSLLTSLVKPSEVGQVLGASAVIESIGMIFCQVVINTLYSASVSTMPNLVFFFCASIAGIACILAFLIHPVKSTTDEEA